MGRCSTPIYSGNSFEIPKSIKSGWVYITEYRLPNGFIFILIFGSAAAWVGRSCYDVVKLSYLA